MKNDEAELEGYFDRLWPITRSITGDGLRASLKIISELVPLEVVEVPTGTDVFDWTVPEEWNVKQAYIITPEGKKIADLSVNNLHLVSYSSPIDTELSFDELDKHLHSLPEMPDAIPYVTSYYHRTWGFCITHTERLTLSKHGKYRVVIDSSFKNGSMSYGEALLPGDSGREILFSTYLCHPSMANNELSGPLVTAMLYRRLAALKKRTFTYRFVFLPETIGAIAFLSKQGEHLKDHLQAGYVVTCIGDKGAFTYKRSKDPSREVDRVAEHILKFSGLKHSVIDFAIGGSDERQYCSPGFDLPVGSLMRTTYQRYKEYHTSLDDRSFISFGAMNDSVDMYEKICKAHELNNCYINEVQYGEPHLGKRGLYPTVGAQKQRSDELSKRLHLLSWANGKHDLLFIAEKANRSMLDFEDTIGELLNKNLLR